MNKDQLHSLHKRTISYSLIAVIVWSIVYKMPYDSSSYFSSHLSLITTPLLFILLVWLTARLARTSATGLGVLCTGIFILLFNPGMDRCFARDEVALIELGSQCMVPFFFSQYTRIRKKDFQRGYFLMFLMGIFCSYTHNGVAIPLCACFLWITWRHRERFFKMACWPMVIGFLIGTTLSVLTTEEQTHTLPEQLLFLSQTTWTALTTLWDAKVFVLSVGITAYMLNTQGGRTMLIRMVRRHYAICVCMAFSLLSLPLAPLGIANAVTGVCFFCMFWLLFITKYVTEKYFGRKI